VLAPKPSDQETYAALRYFQLVEGRRPDVHLDMLLFSPLDDMQGAVLAQVRAQMWCRPLYLVSLHPDTIPLATLREEFEIVPQANLHRLLPRQPRPAESICPDLDARWAGLSIEQLITRAMRWR
jgi:hypothetical protein